MISNPSAEKAGLNLKKLSNITYNSRRITMNIQDGQRIITALKSTKKNKYALYQNDEDRQKNQLRVTRAIDHTSLTLQLDDYAKFDSYGELDVNKTAAFILKMTNKAFRSVTSNNQNLSKEDKYMHFLILTFAVSHLIILLFEALIFWGEHFSP